jgi:prophage regulatory protein
MEERTNILRKRGVLQKTGLSGTTQWRREKAGDFPKRISLGGKTVGWLECEIDIWLKEKAAAREKQPLKS